MLLSILSFILISAFLLSLTLLKRNTYKILGISLIWLVPMFHQSLTNTPLPGFHYFEDLHNTGGLFAKRVSIWEFYDVQYQPDVKSPWKRLPPTKQISQIKTTADRNRVGEYLSYSDVADRRFGQLGFNQRQYLAQWIRDKYSEDSHLPIKAVRFVKGWYESGAQLKTFGSFSIPNIKNFPNSRVLSTHYFQLNIGTNTR